MTRKPRSHERILIHRTWAIAAAPTCRPAQEPTKPWHSKHCLVHDSLHFYQMCAGETNQCFHFGIVVFVFLLKKNKSHEKETMQQVRLAVEGLNPFPLKDKKILKYIPCMFRTKEKMHAGHLVFKPFIYIAVVICFNHKANQFNHAGINTLFPSKKDSHNIIYPVQERPSQNYRPYLQVCALAPNFYSWLTKKSYFFDANHMQGALNFRVLEH